MESKVEVEGGYFRQCGQEAFSKENLSSDLE